MNERDKNGSTALMHATWHATSANGGLEVMALLVAQGADVNVRRGTVQVHSFLHVPKKTCVGFAASQCTRRHGCGAYLPTLLQRHE